MALALFLALVALLVTMVERIPEMAAASPAKIRHDDELVLQFGTIPERPTHAAHEGDVVMPPGEGVSWNGDGAGGDTGTSAGASGEWYVVQRGDTLSSIALKRLGSAGHAADLARLNRLSDPDDLRPGDRIRIR